MAASASWLRHPVLAGVIGVFAGGLSIALIEWLGHQVLGAANPAQPETITTPHFVAVLVAWLVGAGVAALVATAWCGGRSPWPGRVAGGVLLAGSVATMFAFPHPVWMMAIAGLGMPAVIWLAARARTPGEPV